MFLNIFGKKKKKSQFDSLTWDWNRESLSVLLHSLCPLWRAYKNAGVQSALRGSRNLLVWWRDTDHRSHSPHCDDTKLVENQQSIPLIATAHWVTPALVSTLTDVVAGITLPAGTRHQYDVRKMLSSYVRQMLNFVWKENGVDGRARPIYCPADLFGRL